MSQPFSMSLFKPSFGTDMKTEKEILAEFTALVFEKGQPSAMDIFSKQNLLKGSLSSVRLAANDVLELSALMRQDQQNKLNLKMKESGLPSLTTMHNKAFRDFLKIANRGIIKKEQEYRLVRSVSETTILSLEQQSVAYKLLESYEQTHS